MSSIVSGNRAWTLEELQAWFEQGLIPDDQKEINSMTVPAKSKPLILEDVFREKQPPMPNVYFRTNQKDIYIMVHPHGGCPSLVDVHKSKTLKGLPLVFNDKNPFHYVVMDSIKKEVAAKFKGIHLFAYGDCCLGVKH